MNAVKYDLIVVGSGPSGQRAAVAASKMKKRVCVVEARSVVGGACINTGTIPSKTMREAVLHLSGYNYRSIYGMNYRVKDKITMADLAFRVQHVIKTEVDVTEAQLSRNNVEVLTGTDRFEDPTHIRVTNSRGSSVYESRNTLIAVGSRPASNPKVPLNGRNIINSDQVLFHARSTQDPHRGGRRCHRRRIHLHVRCSRCARHPDRKTTQAAGVCRSGNCGSAQLSPAR